MHHLVSSRRSLTLLGTGVAVLVTVLLTRPNSARTEGKAPEPDKAAVDRTRETVRMLDDLYKGTVVHITETYVKARERTPAARVVKELFKDMDAKGWHSARLIDATGSPVNRENVAKTEFEKKAVEKIRSGKPYYEEVGTKKGKPVLRAATVVPVVMKQCIHCHPGTKEGEVLGAIVYEVPIK